MIHWKTIMYECLFWDCEHRDVAQDAELCLMSQNVTKTTPEENMGQVA